MKGKMFGYVTFRLLGADCESFFTDAVDMGIKIYDVRNVKGMYYAGTRPGDYIKLARLKRKYHIQMQLTEKRGFSFKLYKYRYRYGIILGAAAFCLIVFFYGGGSCSATLAGLELTDSQWIQFYNAPPASADFLSAEIKSS